VILVTGASGFVGSRLVVRALARGHRVRGLYHHPPTAPPPGVQVAVGDLDSPTALAPALRGVQVVFHTAALVASQKPASPGAYDRVNRIGTENLAAAARMAGVERFVLLSGLGTRAAPRGTYMATRHGMERAVLALEIPSVILRPSVLFGEGAEFVAALDRVIRSSPVVPLLGGGRVRLQPLHVQDLITCLLAAGEDGRLAGRQIELGGAEQLSFKELIEAICQVGGRHRWLAPVPLGLARLQAGLMEAVLPRPPLTVAALELFGFDNVTRPDSVRRDFGFDPIGFRAHLQAHGLS